MIKIVKPVKIVKTVKIVKNVERIYFKVVHGSEAGLVQRDDTIKIGTLGGMFYI